MTKKQRALEIIPILEGKYPEALCSLDYEKDYELLFSVRLAAQCTDARVNIVAKDLYAKYQSLEDFANADITELEGIVRPCGFYRTKAKDLKETAALLLLHHNGKVPSTMEELLALKGIGRKTANLILGDIYGQPAIVCDTHCIRITNRLGLAEGTDPYKVELQLQKVLPPDKSSDFCHRMVLFGREICNARSPKCEECPLRALCKNKGAVKQKKTSDKQAKKTK